MHLKQFQILSLVLLALAGCCSAKVLPSKPEIVKVEVSKPMKIDPLLLQYCNGKPSQLYQGMKNIDILLHDFGQSNYIACLESRLDGIRRYNDSVK